jgi:polysaccharide chain length determinant protein (PEP-CTERM system associated)
MEDIIRIVNNALRGIWQRRWIGLAAAWLAALIGAVVIWRMPDKYEATARVYVDTQSVLRPLLSGMAVQPNVEQEVGILSRTLISRPNVERLIRMTDMDLKLHTPTQKEDLIESLTKDLKIATAGRDNIYTISFRDPEPEQAKRVVQSLLSIFVESGLGDKRKDADSAKKFIEEQIRTYEKRLEEAENRMKEFRLRHLGHLGTDNRDYFARMGQLSQEISQARLDLRAAEQSRDALKREVAGEDPGYILDTPGPGGQAQVSEFDARIDGLKRQLDELLRRYTDQHPDVVGTRRIIAELEQQKKADLEAKKKAAAGGAPAAPSSNPIYQRLKFALAEAEANVAAQRGKVAELESRLAQLRSAAQMQPQIEAELTQLNRDYEIQKKQYESLATRREAAAISGEMDAAGAADFRIIDPPRATPNPVSPNRLIIVPLLLLGALALGAGVSLLASQLYPTFHDSRSLREVTARPVLGSVSLVETPPLLQRRRRLNLVFASSLASLVLVYGGWIAWLSTHSRVLTG